MKKSVEAIKPRPSESSSLFGSSVRDSWFKERSRHKRSSIFDIPPALPKQKMQQVDRLFEEKKRYLAHRLPIYTPVEIARFRYPHHVTFLYRVTDCGYPVVAQELKGIISKEEQAISEMKNAEFYKPLVENHQKLEYLGDQLMASTDLVRKGKLEMAVHLRKKLAEEILESKGENLTWLATHLLQTCVELAKEIQDVDRKTQIQGEVNCILGYLELEQENHFAFKTAMTYLEESRQECKDKDWPFQSKVLILRIKKPVCLYGLRNDYEVIDGRSMTIHSIATLLMYEALSLKASQVVFSSASTMAELKAAHECAQDALTMAEESRQWVAMSTAQMLLGAIFLKQGDFEDALDHFTHFRKRAAIRCDFEAEAIAFNMIGCCHLGLQDPTNALESFVCQKEVADEQELEDLAIDALQNIGQVLLAEGLTVEAEACCYLVNQRMNDLDTPVMNKQKLLNNSWIRFAISAGMNSWSRMAGLCRLAKQEQLVHVNKWKGYRRPMPVLKHVPFGFSYLKDVYPQANPEMKALPETESNIDHFFKINKHLLDGISNNGVPFGEEPTSTSLLATPDGNKRHRSVVRVKYSAMAQRSKLFSQTVGPAVDFDSDVSTGPYESDRRRAIMKSKKTFSAVVAFSRFKRLGAARSHSEEEMGHTTTTQSESSLHDPPSRISDSDVRLQRSLTSFQSKMKRNTTFHGGISLAASMARARDSMWQQSAISLALMNRTGFVTREKLSVANI